MVKGIRIGTGSLSINHLFFLQMKACYLEALLKKGVDSIHKIFSTHELASENKVYVDKSLIIFGSNVTDSDRNIVSSILGVCVSLNSKSTLVCL